jgi:hypothetical protein
MVLWAAGIYLLGALAWGTYRYATGHRASGALACAVIWPLDMAMSVPFK